MGNSSSQLKGYRVLRVIEGSPAAKCGLNPFLDIIVGADDVSFGALAVRDKNGHFRTFVSERKDKEIKLHVFSLVDRRVHEKTLVPSEFSQGKGILGASVNFESVEETENSIFRVLNVQKGSPAEKCGLASEVDYLLAVAGAPIRSLSDLVSIVGSNASNIEAPALELAIYNSVRMDIRIVKVKPSPAWGGSSILGCQFGQGEINRIPMREESDSEQESDHEGLYRESKTKLGGMLLSSDGATLSSDGMNASDGVYTPSASKGLPVSLPGDRKRTPGTSTTETSPKAKSSQGRMCYVVDLSTPSDVPPVSVPKQ